MSLAIILPDQLRALNPDATHIETPEDALAAFAEVAESQFDFAEPTRVKLASGVQALRADFTSVSTSFESMTAGFALSTAVGGTIVLVVAFGEGMNASELTAAYAVCATLDILYSALTPGLNLDENPTATEYTDFAMGALISFRAIEEGDTAICGLLARAALHGRFWL